MSDKANLAVDGVELTVYFYIKDGPPAPCHYCGKPGMEQLVDIESIEGPSGTVSPDADLFKAAKAKMERVRLHRRGICRIGSQCEDRFIDDQLESDEVV